jgi:hypothetical protein
MHTRVTETERRDTPIPQHDWLLESLEPRGIEAAGVAQTFGGEQAVVDLITDRPQVAQGRQCLGRLEVSGVIDGGFRAACGVSYACETAA